MPSLSGPLVAALVYDGLCLFEYAVTAEIFGLARPEMGPGWYRFAPFAVELGPLSAQGGLTVVAASHDPGLLAAADLIVVPGWRAADAPVPAPLVEQLRAAHKRGARLASICSGAFVLAATGLLDGRVATTHWRYAEALRERFPRVTVDERALYSGGDRLFTSAGSAAGIDLLIDLVRQDFGPAAANSVARRLVMPAHRSGGQAQFLDRPVPLRPEAAIAPLLERCRAELARPWPIATLAAQARMSPRTFLRRFRDATGMAPGDWLTQARVEEAKRLLAETRLSSEAVAAAVGLGGADALRHHFRRRVGLSPGAWRERFAAAPGRAQAAASPMPSSPSLR